MRQKHSTVPRPWLGLAGVALLVLALAPVGRAQDSSERILSFHSDIRVIPDGSMEVRETIKVRAAGEEIKRGIYRDFPTHYRDRLRNEYVVSFEVLGVQRDGKDEPFHIESASNGKRVYIGEKSTHLEPGEYTYTLSYRTNRQLGFFPDHDELYWNVTGNGWTFPIEQASAAVTLPAGIHREAILLDGYTGPQESIGRAFESAADSESHAVFSTTKPLQAEEGLTIVVSWPKGFITEPTREIKIRWFLEDNASTLVGLIGLVILLAYYIVTWALVGKDPAAGVIMPLYEPPPGFSPAAVRYLTKMGYDDRTFAAAIINMAVKRYLTIVDQDGEYAVRRAQGDKSDLSVEERQVADKLLGGEEKIELKNTNHAKIGAAVEALKTALRMNQDKVYFFTNQRYLIPGLVFSVLVLAFVGLAAPGESKFVALFMIVWLSGWSAGVFFLVSQVLQAWRNTLFGAGHKAASLGMAIFLSLFALPFLGGEIAGLVVLGYVTSAVVILILLAMMAINYLFHYLLKAPTHAGRVLLDQIAGFKMFLAAVEKDRLNFFNPPERTPYLFEKYLPYALALDVEQQWSEQFSEVLAQAGERRVAYSPGWYSGTSWSSLGASGFASSLGSSFSGAISSSSHAPGSSSGGGGGGSSGGGGGGGGGGGW
ncbi:MAG: DUF2207 domain-containing protein [Terriglobia bacterium]